MEKSVYLISSKELEKRWKLFKKSYKVKNKKIVTMDDFLTHEKLTTNSQRSK